MELETINKLFLELSQFATAKTKREQYLEDQLKHAQESHARVVELEDVLRSARCIAERFGEDTAWQTFANRIAALGIGSVTPKVFKLPSDVLQHADFHRSRGERYHDLLGAWIAPHSHFLLPRPDEYAFERASGAGGEIFHEQFRCSVCDCFVRYEREADSSEKILKRGDPSSDSFRCG